MLFILDSDIYIFLEHRHMQTAIFSPSVALSIHIYRSSFFRRLLLDSHFDAVHHILTAKFGGQCLWGTLPVDSLYSAWEKCASLSLGHRSEMLLTIDMWSSFLEVFSRHAIEQI